MGFTGMRYILYAAENGIVKIADSFDDEGAALKRLKYYYKKNKTEVHITFIPQIKEGTAIYKRDGSLWGKVVYETGKLLGISNDDGDAIPDPYGKDRIDRIIIAQNFVVADGQEVPDFNGAIELDKALKEKAYDVQSTVRPSNTQQVASL